MIIGGFLTKKLGREEVYCTQLMEDVHYTTKRPIFMCCVLCVYEGSRVIFSAERCSGPNVGTHDSVTLT